MRKQDLLKGGNRTGPRRCHIRRRGDGRDMIALPDPNAAFVAQVTTGVGTDGLDKEVLGIQITDESSSPALPWRVQWPTVAGRALAP
jgi:hypothetical protein